MIRAAVLALPLLAVPFVAPASAQIFNGRIIGTIVDDSGRTIAGASIEVRNPQATPPVRQATSDDEGRFGVMGLRSGTWMVMVEAKGHEPAALAIDVAPARAGRTFTIPLVRIAQLQPPAFASVSPASVLKDLDQADRLLAQGKAAEALALYEATQRRAPALTSLHLAIGRAARATKDYRRAEAAYIAFLAKEPASLQARYELGLTLDAAGDAAGARRELERVAQEGGDATVAARARERLSAPPR